MLWSVGQNPLLRRLKHKRNVRPWHQSKQQTLHRNIHAVITESNHRIIDVPVANSAVAEKPAEKNSSPTHPSTARAESRADKVDYDQRWRDKAFQSTLPPAA